jgi:hypothetical protein
LQFGNALPITMAASTPILFVAILFEHTLKNFISSIYDLTSNILIWNMVMLDQYLLRHSHEYYLHEYFNERMSAEKNISTQTYSRETNLQYFKACPRRFAPASPISFPEILYFLLI